VRMGRDGAVADATGGLFRGSADTPEHSLLATLATKPKTVFSGFKFPDQENYTNGQRCLASGNTKINRTDALDGLEQLVCLAQAGGNLTRDEHDLLLMARRMSQLAHLA
jgi:hypothetical protein